MKKIFLLLLLTINAFSQNDKVKNLDLDFGFPFAKLEEKFSNINKEISFFPFKCSYCDADDSIALKYDIKSLDKILINGIQLFNAEKSGGRYCNMFFVDSSLYKIEITFDNTQEVQNSLLDFFTKKYGTETKKNGAYKIWETPNTYLNVFIPNVINEHNNWCKIILYSKKMQLEFDRKLNAIKNKTLITSGIHIGKGNSTFIPDITNCKKLLIKNITKDNLEKLLPSFSVSDSTVSNSYNSKTEKWDIINSIVYIYKFTYANKYPVTLEVSTKLDRKIKELKFEFEILPVFFKRNDQLNINGFKYNEYSSSVGTKLNFGNTLSFYDSGNICVVLDKSLYKFNIFRTEK